MDFTKLKIKLSIAYTLFLLILFGLQIACCLIKDWLIFEYRGDKSTNTYVEYEVTTGLWKTCVESGTETCTDIGSSNDVLKDNISGIMISRWFLVTSLAITFVNALVSSSLLFKRTLDELISIIFLTKIMCWITTIFLGLSLGFCSQDKSQSTPPLWTSPSSTFIKTSSELGSGFVALCFAFGVSVLSLVLISCFVIVVLRHREKSERSSAAGNSTSSAKGSDGVYQYDVNGKDPIIQAKIEQKKSKPKQQKKDSDYDYDYHYQYSNNAFSNAPTSRESNYDGVPKQTSEHYFLQPKQSYEYPVSNHIFDAPDSAANKNKALHFGDAKLYSEEDRGGKIVNGQPTFISIVNQSFKQEKHTPVFPVSKELHLKNSQPRLIAHARVASTLSSDASANPAINPNARHHHHISSGNPINTKNHIIITDNNHQRNHVQELTNYEASLPTIDYPYHVVTDKTIPSKQVDLNTLPSHNRHAPAPATAAGVIGIARKNHGYPHPDYE